MLTAASRPGGTKAAQGKSFQPGPFPRRPALSAAEEAAGLPTWWEPGLRDTGAGDTGRGPGWRDANGCAREGRRGCGRPSGPRSEDAAVGPPPPRVCAPRGRPCPLTVLPLCPQPQNEHIELHRKRYGYRLDYHEKRRKKEGREAHERSRKAKKMIGLKAKLYHKQRHAEKIQMKKT